jgi:hypothetical protein
MSRQRARPVYTPELAHEICRRLTEGETLRVICQADEMPAASTVRLWVLDNIEGFADQYARARLVGYHSLADELIEIADNPDIEAAAVNRDRLKVDTRKWLLGKALPKLYGDKLAIDAKVEDTTPPRSTLDRARRIAFLFARAQREAEKGRRDLLAKQREAERAAVSQGEEQSTRHW